MARKPSDDIRDAARKLKVQAQRNPRVLAPGTTAAFSDKTAHPKVNNTQTDLKIDHKESHHLMPVDAYTSYTEGMTPEQIAEVDARAESQRFYKGDNNLNRTDLWKRYHTGRSKGVYKGKGAHQIANQAGVDGPKAKAKWAAMTPDERFANLDLFMDDMTKNRTIGYQANMDARMLLGNSNTPDNIYGGNFSQRILNPRDPKLAASTAKKTNLQRQFLNSQPSLDIPRLPRGGSKAAKWLLPGASLTIGFGQAGHAASQGDYAGAAAHGVGALVGEVPLIGDAVVESVAGTGLTDGTLQGNLNRVPKKGPKNTAAPTGNKKFDNVFQPFNKMLNGITPTPKKPDFKQTAISAFNTP
jgi:hypothetical protein